MQPSVEVHRDRMRLDLDTHLQREQHSQFLRGRDDREELNAERAVALKSNA